MIKDIGHSYGRFRPDHLEDGVQVPEMLEIWYVYDIYCLNQILGVPSEEFFNDPLKAVSLGIKVAIRPSIGNP
jgi:hypothetical protein